MKDEDKSREQLLNELDELRRRESLTSHVVKASPDTVLLTRLSDGRILEANEGFTRNSGYTRSEAVGRTTSELNLWDSAADREEFVRIIEERGECLNFAAAFRAKDGRIIQGLVSAHVTEVDGEPCLFSNTRDITQLKESEQALTRQAFDLAETNRRLAAKEEELATAIQSSPDSIVVTRLDDGMVIDVNAAFSRSSGYSRSEAIGKNASELKAWLSEEARRDFVATLRRDGHCINYPNTFRSKDGSISHVLISAHLIEVDGETCIFSNVRNITHLKRIEETLARQADELKAANYQLARKERELEERHQRLLVEVAERKESEVRFRTVVESLGEALLITDVDDVVLDLNERVTELTGFSAAELLGKPAYEVLLARDEWPDMLNRNRRRVGGQDERYEIELRRRDGTWFWAEVFAAPNRNASGEITGTLGAMSDITKRKRMEAELMRLERMSALGEMAQGVAHNFNNLLSVVLGYAEIIQSKVSNPDIDDDLRELIDGTLQAAELVERLNYAVRSEGESAKPVSLETVGRRVLEVSRPRWKDEPEARGVAIDMVANFANTPLIQGTESGLHNIFINLIFNAVDALPNGGTIRLSTERDGDSVQLIVADDGVGMDDETRRRVFDPFFSTKMTVGTGLGLSTVYGTVSRWGGECQVESEVDAGTTFRIRFPIAAEVAQPTPGAEPATASGRRGRILLIEDEEHVSTALSHALSDKHDVEVFHSGVSALESFSRGRYDVALIDLGMSGMPGDRVAGRVRATDPHIATVLITGWGLADGDPRLECFDFRLTKPIRAASLVDTVARSIQLRDQRAG